MQYYLFQTEPLLPYKYKKLKQCQNQKFTESLIQIHAGKKEVLKLPIFRQIDNLKLLF